MPSMEVTNTWALPVRAETLLANLQTYAATRTKVDALRKCKGSIRKLPRELMDKIEAWMIVNEREPYAARWERDSRCFQDRCTSLDHLSGQFVGPYHPDQYAVWEEKVHAHEKDYHKRNVDGFINATRVPFREDFGLDIWHTHEEDGATKYGVPYLPSTITYLTLPKRVERGGIWRENDPYSHGMGLGMVVKKGRGPTVEELGKFTRTRNILILEVFVHPSQQGPGLVSGVLDEEDDNEDDTGGMYPREVVLIRAHS